jgi:uncharacterized membrane protein YqjE
MFLLFGGGGRRGRTLLFARLTILVLFLIVVAAFHPHGTALDIVQGVRIALVIALIALAFVGRRRRA